MSKYLKPADQHAVAGKTITLEVTQITDVPVVTTYSAHTIHPGKVNYLGKTKPPKAKPATVAPARRVERTAVMQGRYFGSAEQVCAFVMLDEDTAPKGDAANDSTIR